MWEMYLFSDTVLSGENKMGAAFAFILTAAVMHFLSSCLCSVQLDMLLHCQTNSASPLYHSSHRML